MGLIVGTSDYTHKFLTVVWDQELQIVLSVISCFKI